MGITWYLVVIEILNINLIHTSWALGHAFWLTLAAGRVWGQVSRAQGAVEVESEKLQWYPTGIQANRGS